MRRPLYIGALFATCLAVGAAATVWLSATILRLDREQQEYQQLAALEEKVRLALWRMDSALGPFIAAESMRPYNLYSAFYPATEAVDLVSNELINSPVLIPSPLLTFRSPYIRIHFQLDATGQLTSPQVPDDEQLPLAQANYLAPGELVESIDRLVELKQRVHYDALLAQLAPAAHTAPPNLNEAPTQVASTSAQATSNISELFSRINQANVQMQTPALKIMRNDDNTVLSEAQNPTQDFQLSDGLTPALQDTFGTVQSDIAALDAVNDSLMLGGGFGGGGGGFGGGGFGGFGASLPTGGLAGGEPDGVTMHNPKELAWAPREWKEDPITPLWVGGELMLVRPVRAGNLVRLQGCWLDWPAIETWLVGLCADLLPEANLVAVEGGVSDDPEMPGRQLASLPVRLAPGQATPALPDHPSPLPGYLLASVGGIVVATLAIAVLLWGAVALSERRAQFVSAVTHELRSPLTTFRLYTEMLASGMVNDELKRQQYFETLHTESGRLAHLVENVLAYARLERGRLADRFTVHPVAQLLANAVPRLEQRTAQSTMTLIVEEAAGDASLRVDSDIVEQILYNLVDNACKYAATAADRRIHLETSAEPRTVTFRVRDHGPGIRPRDARRIFRPFTKSVHEAARSAPGVGLGLGLSRRLARSAGGTLRLETTEEGASFALTLPRRQ